VRCHEGRVAGGARVGAGEQKSESRAFSEVPAAFQELVRLGHFFDAEPGEPDLLLVAGQGKTPIDILETADLCFAQR
jgi:hypothetical protein